MGQGSKTKTKSTTRTGIVPEFQGPSLDVIAQAQAASKAVSKEPFGGQFFAGQTPLQKEGLAAQEAAARRFTGGQEILDLASRFASADFLDPSAAIKAATEPTLEAFQQVIVPRILSGAEAAGASGGSREGVVLANTARDTERVIGDIAAKIALASENQRLGFQAQSPQLFAAGSALELLPGQVLSEIGAQQQQFDQIDLDEILAQFQEQQQAPFRGINELAAILSAFQPPTTTTTTGVSQTTPDPLAEILRFGIGAASTAALLAFIFGTPAGPAAAAGTGGAFGTGGFIAGTIA